MPFLLIIWVIICLLIANKWGLAVGIRVFYFPCVLGFLLCMYAINLAELFDEIFGFNIIGIGSSLLWCLLLKKFASKQTFIWMGIVPSILIFLTIYIIEHYIA